MIRKISISLFICGYTLIFSCAKSSSDPITDGKTPQSNAYLVPVGGGATSDAVLSKILRLTSLESPTVLTIPYAASAIDLQKTISGSIGMFTRLGVKNIKVLDTANRVEALRFIESSQLIWMSGGSQSALREALENTGLADKILLRYQQGGVVIAGTSAGASVMSEVMMAKSVEDKITNVITPILSHGLKLWPEVIIDQHFTQRNRLERLEKAIMQHKDLLGIGIDEGTAVVHTNDGKLTVWGKGTVSFVKHDPNSNKLKTKVLKDGEIYPL